MYAILMIFLVNTLVSAEDFSDETKYIDLLPEKEKQDFLERVARRIFNGVQSKDDRESVSGEVSATQMDEHDEFVKKILEEESLNLRKHGDDLGDVKSVDVDSGHKRDEDNVKSDTVEKKDTAVANAAGLVDLTLRDGKRNKRNSFEKIYKNSKIINVSVSKGDNNLLNKKRNLSNVRLTQDKDEFDVEDIQIKNFRQHLQQVDNTKELETATHKNSEPQVTQMLDFEAEIKDKKGYKPFRRHIELVDNNTELETTTWSYNKTQITKMIDFEDIVTSKEETVTAPDKSANNGEDANDNEHIGDVNKNNNADIVFGSTQKIYESFENKNDTKDSEENDTVTESTENTTAYDNSTNSNLKSTLVPTTEKILNEKYTNIATKTHKNINLKSPYLRSYSISESSESNKELVVKNITKEITGDTALIDSTSIAIETDQDSELKINSYEKTEAGNTTNKTIVTTPSNTNKEYATEKNTDVSFTTFKAHLESKTEPASLLEKINSDVIATNKTVTSPSITYKENTTEIYTDKDFTTLKIEVMTKSSLRTETEKSYLKESVDGTVVNSKQFEKQVTADKLKRDIIKDQNLSKLKMILHNDTKYIKKENLDQNHTLEKNTYNLANDMIKALRAKIPSEPYYHENNIKGLKVLYEDEKPKEYKVYKVPKYEQPVMQKDQQDIVNKENPYYVPIYNYSPNNAYYNPHNRYGPNDDDNIVNDNAEDEKFELDDNNRRDINLGDDNGDNTNAGSGESDRELSVSNELLKNKSITDKDLKNLLRLYKNYKSQRKFRFGNTNSKINKNKFQYKLNLPVVVQYPKFTDIILNANDYSDIDYARTQDEPTVRNRCEIKKEESNNIFPDSTEEDHPYNAMNDENNLKDHLSSVRQILYKNKRFGYLPSINETTKSVNGVDKTLKQISRTRPNRKPAHYKSTNKNIAIDYFFGRTNEDSETKPNKVKIIYNKHPKALHKLVNSNNKNRKRKYRNNRKPHKMLYKGKKHLHHDINPATPSYPNVFPQYNLDHLLRMRLKNSKTKKNITTDFNTIKKILSIADETDLLPTLDKLLKLNLTTETRKGSGVNLEPYVMVLGDMMRNDAEGLKQYDWLHTTVDVQAALLKMKMMTEKSQKKINLFQPDQQLLKYIIYLHKCVKKQKTDFRKNTLLLPRNKKKRGQMVLKQSGLLSRNWLIRMMEAANTDRVITEEDLNDFNEFLNDLQFYLNDLHTAIKQIANITKYKSQRWFENLKELYLDSRRKHLLEVLLHITATRLLDLIENGAARGVEDDFLTFVMKNEKDVERTKDEFCFVLKIIENLKNTTRLYK